MSSDSIGRALALSLVLAVAPQTTHAQEGAEYRTLVDEAVAEFNRGNFREAHALFRQAHTRSPSSRTHRGLGMALFEMRRYADAIRELNAALEDTRRLLSGSQREHVNGLLARSARFVGRYRLVLDPPNATVRVGGRAIDVGQGLILDIGDHMLRVEAEGFEASAERVRVEGGEQTELTIRLQAVEAGPTEPAPVPMGDPPEDQPPDPDPLDATSTGSRSSSPGMAGAGDDSAGVALLGVAGALAAVIIATGATWGYVGDQRASCTAAEAEVTSGCLNADQLETGETAAAALTIASGSLALLFAISGAVILAAGGDDAETAARCAPTLGGLVCAGRF